MICDMCLIGEMKERINLGTIPIKNSALNYGTRFLIIDVEASLWAIHMMYCMQQGEIWFFFFEKLLEEI